MKRFDRNLALIVLVLFLPIVGCNPSTTSNTEESIIGFWRVVEASADGDPYPEYIGTIYEFREDNTLRFVSAENEGIQEYRINVEKQPKTLATWFFYPETADSGIYTLSQGVLRLRTALDAQDLQFSSNPTGRWWEYEFIRITEEEAAPAIDLLQEKHLAGDE